MDNDDDVALICFTHTHTHTVVVSSSSTTGLLVVVQASGTGLLLAHRHWFDLCWGFPSLSPTSGMGSNASFSAVCIAILWSCVPGPSFHLLLSSLQTQPMSCMSSVPPPSSTDTIHGQMPQKNMGKPVESRLILTAMD
jgi:hypothetical protein